MTDRIIEALWSECRDSTWAEFAASVPPLTAAVVARAGVGVCPECGRVERDAPVTAAGMSTGLVARCSDAFHDIHEAYEHAKAERGHESATFSDYDEERRLIAGFGESTVSWQGVEWAVRFAGTVYRLQRGAVTQYGIRELKRAMRAEAERGLA